MIKSKIKKVLNSNYFIPIVLILSVFLRIVWIALVDSKPVSDSTWYYGKGVEIAEGKGYTIDGVPTAYYPVGYPMFLGVIFAIFGNSLLVLKLANIFLAVGIVFFSYSAAKRISGSETIGRITLLILALYPNHIAYTSIAATEMLFLFLLLFGAYLLDSSARGVNVSKQAWLSLILSGLVWGFMCLVKPQGFFIPLLFLVTSFYFAQHTLRQKAKSIVIVYLFILLVMTPWFIRNYNVFDKFFIISTNDGINLVMGNNPFANGEYYLEDAVIAYLWDNENEYSTPELLTKNIHLSKEWTRYGYRDENVANEKFRRKALDYILNNPSKTVKLLPKKLWLNYKKGNEGIGWAIAEIKIEPRYLYTAVIIFGKIANYFYYLVALFALIYFIRATFVILIRKKNEKVPAIGLLIIAYFTLLALIYFGGYRFHFPALPFIAMFSAAFCEFLLNWKKNSSLN